MPAIDKRSGIEMHFLGTGAGRAGRALMTAFYAVNAVPKNFRHSSFASTLLQLTEYSRTPPNPYPSVDCLGYGLSRVMALKRCAKISKKKKVSKVTKKIRKKITENLLKVSGKLSARPRGSLCELQEFCRSGGRGKMSKQHRAHPKTTLYHMLLNLDQPNP